MTSLNLASELCACSNRGGRWIVQFSPAIHRYFIARRPSNENLVHQKNATHSRSSSLLNLSNIVERPELHERLPSPPLRRQTSWTASCCLRETSRTYYSSASRPLVVRQLTFSWIDSATARRRTATFAHWLRRLECNHNLPETSSPG
jgi:hypothetical protein